MNLSELQPNFCEDLNVRYHRVSDREFLSSRFHYADGELICAYAGVRNGKSFFTDRGNTFFKLEMRGLSIEENRRDLIKKLVAPYGLYVDGKNLIKFADQSNANTSFIDYCVAIERVSALEVQFHHRRPNYLSQMVDSLIVERVEPERQVHRNWCMNDIDTHQSYPVDYHFNGVGKGRNLFTVSSREKGLLVSAVSNFYRANNSYSPTLVVFDTESPLPKRHINRVRESVDEVVFGISGAEDRVVEFALSE